MDLLHDGPVPTKCAFRPIADIRRATYGSPMFSGRLISVLAVACASVGCDVSKTRTEADGGGPAETAGPHFANLCIPASDWPRLLSAMGKFGAEHGLEMHGGIERDNPNGASLNVYLAQGYNYFLGDDFDLWFVSDRFRKDVVVVNGIVKRKPITSEQRNLAEALLSKVEAFTSRASGPTDNPSCDHG